ncbi:MAG: hypothetical protein PVJ55_01870 [Anaerolineae bacterium]|jgi:hypothetical protein
MPRSIDALVWRAFTDASFRKGLLNGRRPDLVDALDLTAEEREAVLAVEAESLEDFAVALCQACSDPSLAQCWNPA